MKPFVFELLTFPTFDFGLGPGFVEVRAVDSEFAVATGFGADVTFEDNKVAAASEDHFSLRQRDLDNEP